MNKNMRKGFTTVELVIVIAVIAILATALIPTFGGLINSANKTAAREEARQIFNDYMLVKTTEAAGANYFIKVVNNSTTYYFEVINGQLQTEPEAAAPTAGETAITIITAVNVDTKTVTSETIPASTTTEGSGT